MRYSWVLFIGLLCGFLSAVLGSYDGGYASTHAQDHDDYYEHEPSYPAPPIVHPHHGGHSAGSYYHYHVPLVGQQQHYQPSYHHQPDHSHYLWPLLLLLALPLLFLPLLPLLLLPLGISLLALLAPGGMMMMMMMMMMGGEMMMRRDTISGRAFSEMRTFGEVLFVDMASLLSKYARSLDLDQCPQRVACEMGAIIFPENNATDTSTTAKAFSSFLMEQYLPKGKLRRTIKQYEKAFWSGSTNLNACKAFNCQPTFKVYQNVQEESVRKPPRVDIHGPALTSGQRKETHTVANTTSESGTRKNVNYIYPHSTSKVSAKTGNSNFAPSEESNAVSVDSSKPKIKRSQFPSHRDLSKTPHIMKTQSSYINAEKKPYFSNVFGTPTIKS